MDLGPLRPLAHTKPGEGGDLTKACEAEELPRSPHLSASAAVRQQHCPRRRTGRTRRAASPASANSLTSTGHPGQLSRKAGSPAPSVAFALTVRLEALPAPGVPHYHPVLSRPALLPAGFSSAH
jgi:hypothetical protein